MAGKSSGGSNRRKGASAGRGGATHKPSAPPIIDLEATEVAGDAGSAEAAASATPMDDDTTGARRSARGGYRVRARARAWRSAFRDQVSSRAENLPWIRIIAFGAGSVVLVAFGIWVGSSVGPRALVPVATADLEAETQAQISAIETAVNDIHAASSGYGERFDALERRFDQLFGEIGEAERRAGEAGSGLAELRAALEDLPGGGEAADPETAGRLQMQLSGVADRLGALEAAVGALSDAVPADGAGDDRLDELARAFEGLEETVQAATQAVQPDNGRLEGLIGNLQNTLTGLEERIEARLAELEQPQPTVSASVSPIVAASAALHFAVQSGAPYGAEFKRVAELAPGLAGLENLNRFSDTGIPPRDELVRRFGELAQNLKARIGGAAQAAPGGEDVVSGLWDKVRTMVDIRRAGELDRRAALGRVEEAQGAVNEGDLVAALAALGQVKGVADVEIAAWTVPVRARLNADRAMDLLLRRAIGTVPAAGRSGS